MSDAVNGDFKKRKKEAAMQSGLVSRVGDILVNRVCDFVLPSS